MTDILLWHKNSGYKYPWYRQYLHSDFSKYEQKRIRDVRKWFSNFQKARVGQELGEVYYYALPSLISPSLKVEIENLNYRYVSISALRDSLQMPILLLFSRTKQPPRDYSLLRINSAKKTFLHNGKTLNATYVIFSDDFEEADSASIYYDVPFEKKPLYKFITENLVNDRTVASAFQSVLSSAPYVVNMKGGISFSALSSTNSFSQELMHTLKLMQPPEFTDIENFISQRLKDGKLINCGEGIKMHPACKILPSSNLFSGLHANNYGMLEQELISRSRFLGEYSIACTITPRGDTKSEFLTDVASKFVKTEVMSPSKLDDFKEFDIDLARAQSSITEDLWLQVANERKINPTLPISSRLSNIRRELNEQWGIIMSEFGFKKDVDHSIAAFSAASFENVKRVAQGFARDMQHDTVTDSDINRSLQLFVDNADLLVNNPYIRKHAKILIPARQESARFDALRAELLLQPLSLADLFNRLKNQFNNLVELQSFLDKLLIAGHIYKPTPELYRWV